MGEVTNDEVIELVQSSTLEEIKIHEISLTRTSTEALSEKDASPEDRSLSVYPQLRIADNGFGFRLVCETDTEFMRGRFSVSGEYSLTEGTQPPGEKLVERFGTEVGIMAVFPFLRELVATTTAKMFGNQLLLPVIERGEISFSQHSSEESDPE